MCFFLVTPCLVVAVQPCMEWIPIKKKKKKSLSLECKQKLYGFPEDKNFNRKFWSTNFSKYCLNKSTKRRTQSTNCDSQIANSNPVKDNHIIFDELFNALHSKIPMERSQSKCIDVIFGIYLKKSIKNAKQDKRGVKDSTQYKQIIWNPKIQ